MDSVTLTGLTVQQVRLLDKMWSLQNLEDVEAWRSGLPASLQQQVDLLMDLIMLEVTDQMLADDTNEATEYLQKFRL